jgi:hypothetical protein
LQDCPATPFHFIQAVFQVAAGEVQHVGPPVRLLFLPFEQQPLEGGQLQEKAVIE